MRIKQLLLPLALTVPIFFILFLTQPTSTVPQSFHEQNKERLAKSMVALSPARENRILATQSTEDNFDSALALTLLSEITLDENGLPLVNDQLKRQLDNAVRLIGRDRAPADLDKIHDLVKQAFKPETAKAINQMLFQYHAYKIAEEDYTNTLNGRPTTPGDATRNLKSLSDLRESYLGHELAMKLFGKEDTYQNYMVELTERLSRPDLTETARNNITAEVRKKYYPNEVEPDSL